MGGARTLLIPPFFGDAGFARDTPPRLQVFNNRFVMGVKTVGDFDVVQRNAGARWQSAFVLFKS